jgi:tRNA(fMet)-specific endonuclease VapC
MNTSMVYDTNLLLHAIRKGLTVPNRLIIPIVVAGELEALALKSDWGIQKVYRMKFLLNTYPIADITLPITEVYGQIDAFSQGKLKDKPLSMSPRNMGKNDIWIAATALYLDLELHTTDNDFNHLPALGLRLVKH